ncbi:MAG: PIG-L deacetylase family protein [Candidatus Woesearchaeota archaeon]
MTKKETILVFGAHSDDFVLGAGGTLAKYKKEGKTVISVIFSFGEKSHPWLRQTIVQQMRSKEAIEASNILGMSRLVFYDLEELKFYEEYQSKNLAKELLALIETEAPTKIFTHSAEDLHPDHQDVYKITIELWKLLPKTVRPEVYTYSIWNPISLDNKYPSLYVNITKYFTQKMRALKTFRSQKVYIVYPIILLLFRSLKDGLRIRTLFGERFFRIK